MTAANIVDPAGLLGEALAEASPDLMRSLLQSIINALRGIDVQVIQIGSTTCGKPYGFYPQDNCGTTYFSIQFRGLNTCRNCAPAKWGRPRRARKRSACSRTWPGAFPMTC